MTSVGALPLAGIRVVDAVAGPLAPITRYLAELGARVDRVVELQTGDRFADLAANRGKVQTDAQPGSAAFAELTRAAHIVVAERELNDALAELRSTQPEIVTMIVSDFGSEGPLADWQATDSVLHALSGELARSGIRGRAPLIPPGQLAYQCAAVQAAFALVSALFRALRSGKGAHFDFAALDGAVQALDPGFGISGSATLGKPVGLLSRDRPREGFQYPIFPCADGYVRICLLAKRQWRGMFKWMGEPEQFSAPEFDKTAHRYKSPELLPYIGRFFAKRSRKDLEEAGQTFGVPIAAVLTLGEFMESDHVAAREALARTQDDIALPSGVFTIDGSRPGVQGRAASDSPTLTFGNEAIQAPFEGLKVLDLGVIVVGAEQGRLLADYGADVVKIESRNFPDGNRQSYLSFGMSVSFAAGHRNKRGLGIDLRNEEGKALFLDLVRQADIVCSNFKPGTMEKLGIGHEELARVNPRIITSESSAFGNTGPWSARMGYGPLVRAATGLTLAWRYPDDPESFSDSITIYPDHVAGRICAMGVVALLIRRLRTGCGGSSSVAQSEVMLNHFGDAVARHSTGGEADASQDGPSGVYQAKGDDEWCVITVRNDDDWQALCGVVGIDPAKHATTQARRAAVETLNSAIADWAADRTPEEAASALQAAGVPAAPMLRLADLPEHEYYRSRNFYRIEGHRWLQEQVIAEAYVANSTDLPAPPSMPAPLVGEQTEEIVAEWLDYPAERIKALCENGVLEPIAPSTRTEAEKFMASETA